MLNACENKKKCLTNPVYQTWQLTLKTDKNIYATQHGVPVYTTTTTERDTVRKPSNMNI